MARGDSESTALLAARRDEEFLRQRQRLRLRLQAHQEASDLLDDEDVLSVAELEERFNRLGEAIYQFDLFEDQNFDLGEELANLFPVERSILSAGPSDLERMFLEENLLIREAHEDVLPASYIKEVRDSLPAGDWDDEEALTLFFIRRSLPLLRLSGQSMEGLRAKLNDQLAIDIDEASDAEIFSLIASHKGRTKAERREGLRDTLLLIQAVAASRHDPRVLRAEKTVRDNFSWAQKRSALAGRRVKHMPLVAEARTLAWLGFPDDAFPGPQGVAACYLPGFGGVQATMIAAPRDEDFDEGSIKRVMIHEMLHDTQDGFFLTGDKEHDLFYAYSFNEALTEGLGFLRAKEEGRPMHKPAYTEEVFALYKLLEEAGIEAERYEDYLTYLNSIPPTESFALISEKIGIDPWLVRQRFYDLVEWHRDLDFDEEKTPSFELFRRVFSAAQSFPD